MSNEKLKEYSEEAVKWSRSNFTIIKGLAAIIFGIALIYTSHPLLINIIVFACGALLVYYGLVILRMKKITGWIDRIVESIKNIKFGR